MNDAIYWTGFDACLFILGIRLSRIEGNVDIRQRNLYNIYVFGRNGRDGGISSVFCLR